MAIDRTDHDYGDEIPRTSARFGFELTPEIGRALAPALELYDSWEDVLVGDPYVANSSFGSSIWTWRSVQSARLSLSR